MPKKISDDVDDLDSPEWTDEDFKRARPLKEAMPKLYCDLVKFQKAAARGDVIKELKDGVVTMRIRGRPKVAKPRVNKTLRLPADLVAAMEAAGKYSARAEAALRAEFLG